MSTVNWGDLIKDAGNAGAPMEPLPEGDYELKVLESEDKVSQSGRVMFTIKCQVQGGPHANRLIWDNLVIVPDKPNALGMFFRNMECLGLTKDNFWSKEPDNAQVNSALVGRQFRAQVGQRTYNGTKRNEIVRYYPSSASPAASSAPAPAADAPTSGAAVPPPPAAAPAPSPAPGAANAEQAPDAPF